MEQPTIELEYVKFLNDNSIKEEQLPGEIRKQINILKASLGSYKKNLTEAGKNAVIKQDLCVADLIADFIEEGIEEADNKEAEAEAKLKADAEAIAKKQEEERIAKEKAEAEAKQTNEPPTNAEVGKEDKTVPPANVPPVVTKQTKATPPTPPAQTTTIRPEVVAMENKIKEKLAASGNNSISRNDLRDIIGRTPAEPYQQVGNTKLKKVMFRMEYRSI